MIRRKKEKWLKQISREAIKEKKWIDDTNKQVIMREMAKKEVKKGQRGVVFPRKTAFFGLKVGVGVIKGC